MHMHGLMKAVLLQSYCDTSAVQFLNEDPYYKDPTQQVALIFPHNR